MQKLVINKIDNYNCKLLDKDIKYYFKICYNVSDDYEK